MLNLKQVYFDYHDLPLLQDINMEVSKGQLVHIKGENGAGKTTLLRLIIGLFTPHKGCVEYNGYSIYSQLSQFQNDLIFIGHKSGIHPLLTIEESLFFDLKHDKDSQFNDLLRTFKLEDYKQQIISQLSAGQKKRVSLLRLFLKKVPIWILDEPFVSLDKQSIAALCEQIKRHLNQGGSVLMTSHQAIPIKDIDYQEYLLCRN